MPTPTPRPRQGTNQNSRTYNNTRQPAVRGGGSRSGGYERSRQGQAQSRKVGASSGVMRGLIITLGVLVLAVAVLAYLVFSGPDAGAVTGTVLDGPPPAASDDAQKEALLNTDTIYENIFVGGVNVGGLTRAEAASALRVELVNPLDDNEIAIVFENTRLTYSFADLGVSYAIDQAVEEAFAFARDGFLDDRYVKVVNLRANPLEIDAPLIFDENAVREATAALGEHIVFEFKDASMRRENGQFVIEPESPGKHLDVAATALMVADLIRLGKGGEVNAVVTQQSPTITAAQLQNAQSLIGTFQTRTPDNNANRNQNVRNALEKINNVVVMPGEIFSTNEHFGEMTYDNGYRMANVIVGNTFEEGMGGGVCQTSSTLYVALLYSELRIVERRSHSLKVSYVDYAYDATLAGNYIDLKFENDTQYPVLIEGIMDDRDVIVNIYGHEIHPPGRRLEFSNKLIETVEPPEEPILTEDNTLPLGFIEEDQAARRGFKYELYKSVFQDNELVETVRVNVSSYKATPAEGRIGTNPDIPWPVDEPPPVEQTPPDGTPDSPPDGLPDGPPDGLPDGTDPGGADPGGADEPPPDTPPDDWPDGIPLPGDLASFIQ